MIIADKKSTEIMIFEEILEKTAQKLVKDSEEDRNYFINRNPTEFEEDVCDSLNLLSNKTIFQNSFKLISGHAFPDIVSQKIFGVEVKTTKSDKWSTVGNSILESTRVESVDKIYLVFAQLISPFSVRYRKYQDCLEDIKVTHSPRYLINMQLEKGETIFDKIGTSYDELRSCQNPIRPFVNYYRKIAKPGEEPWWMESSDMEEINVVNPTISLWRNFSIEQKKYFTNLAMAYFPELFGNSSQKYLRLASWLASKYGIIDPSLRDNFTAGGRINIEVGGKEYFGLPRIFKHLYDNINEVIDHVRAIPEEDAFYYWKLDNVNLQNWKVKKWSDLVLSNAESILNENYEFIVNLLRTMVLHSEQSHILRENIQKYNL